MAERPAANAGYSPVSCVRMIHEKFNILYKPPGEGVVKVFLGFVSKV